MSGQRKGWVRRRRAPRRSVEEALPRRRCASAPTLPGPWRVEQDDGAVLGANAACARIGGRSRRRSGSGRSGEPGCGRFSRIRGKRPGMRPDRGGGRSGRLELERRGKRVHAPPLAYGAMTGQPFAADAGNAASVVRRDHPRPVLRPDAAAMAHLAGGLVTAADIGGENADALPAVDESRDARGQCRNAWRYCGNACRMLIHGLSVRYVRQARKQNRTLWTIIFRHFVR